jgi:hypothetical protein
MREKETNDAAKAEKMSKKEKMLSTKETADLFGNQIDKITKGIDKILKILGK